MRTRFRFASFSTAFKSPWFWIIAAGYLLRIVLMPLTGQHDVMFMPWQTHFIIEENFNLYAYLYEEFGEMVIRGGIWAPYPYGFYAWTSLWIMVLDQIGLINSSSWSYIWFVPQPARMVFLFKLIYLPFDVLIGYILFRVGGAKLGHVLWALWVWSASVLYIFMMGQNDIYPTAFMMAGLYAATRSIRSTREKENDQLTRWALLAMLLLGIGATFKTFPLFLIPPIALLLTSRWVLRLGLITLGASVFALAALPFLTTPAFVEGVLLNREGVEIFRQVDLFGTPVSLFFLAYSGLLIYLILSDAPPDRESDVWGVAFIVLVLPFLFVPTQFYWVIWLTPLVIALIGQSDQRMLVIWLILEIGFAFLLLYRHRELGVSLPIHLYDEFNMPNLPTTLSITPSIRAQLLARIWPVLNSAVVAAQSGLLLHTIISWRKKKRLAPNWNSQFAPLIFAPVVVMLLGLSINLYIARHLAAPNNWLRLNQSLTLSEENPYVGQMINMWSPTVTGVYLLTSGVDPAVRLRACLRDEPTIDAPALACASTQLPQPTEDQRLYFLFDRVLSVDQQKPYLVTFEVETPNQNVPISYSTTNQEAQLQLGESPIDGTMRAGPLGFFSVRKAFNVLVVQNILKDVPLLIIIFAISVMIVMGVAMLYARHPSYPYSSL